jgi:hypothetical protein
MIFIFLAILCILSALVVGGLGGILGLVIAVTARNGWIIFTYWCAYLVVLALLLSASYFFWN